MITSIYTPIGTYCAHTNPPKQIESLTFEIKKSNIFFSRKFSEVIIKFLRINFVPNWKLKIIFQIFFFQTLKPSSANFEDTFWTFIIHFCIRCNKQVHIRHNEMKRYTLYTMLQIDTFYLQCIYYMNNPF